jgi:3-oxoacyl-(acyl-carrier-protein) synthase
MDDINISKETRDADINRAVSASFGFGGLNAAIMLEKYKG